MNRPEKNEYAEFYAGYVSLVEETDIIACLQDQPDEWRRLLAEIPSEKEKFRYAENKWNIRELLGHIVDGERVFSYRALRISRGDETPLAGFEENSYVANSNFSNIKLSDSLEEFAMLRQSNVFLFKSLTDDMWSKIGMASDAQVSVRALAYIMVGHARHHANILKTRYLISE